jgi:hypothetical protein
VRIGYTCRTTDGPLSHLFVAVKQGASSTLMEQVHAGNGGR